MSSTTVCSPCCFNVPAFSVSAQSPLSPENPPLSAHRQHFKYTGGIGRHGHALQHQQHGRLLPHRSQSSFAHLLAHLKERPRIRIGQAADQLADPDQLQRRNPEDRHLVRVAQVRVVVEHVGRADGNDLLVLVIERPARVQEARIGRVLVRVRREGRRLRPGRSIRSTACRCCNDGQRTADRGLHSPGCPCREKAARLAPRPCEWSRADYFPSRRRTRTLPPKDAKSVSRFSVLMRAVVPSATGRFPPPAIPLLRLPSHSELAALPGER